MSAFAKAVKAELKKLVAEVAREVSGLAHIEHLIVDHGKELVKTAIGNAITNLTTHVDTTGRRAPSQKDIDQWNADRKWVKEKFGI
jgi:hypothetical protein